MNRAWSPLLLVALLSACDEGERAPPPMFEGELVFGRLDATDAFTPYEPDTTTGALEVEVVRGFQGADMVVLTVELAPEYIGTRVDFRCWVETATWSSNSDMLLRDVLVGDDALLHAPYVILGWWEGVETDASIGCTVHGPTRADLTVLDARLAPAPNQAPP